MIVGYDGSDYAKAALRTALEVARTFGDKLLIAYLYEVHGVGSGMGDYRAALREMGDKRIAEAKQLAGGQGVELDAALVEYEPAPGLVALAEKEDARLVVVGTRGENPLKGVLLGSVPHKLLHLATRPVLVVPSPSEG